MTIMKWSISGQGYKHLTRHETAHIWARIQAFDQVFKIPNVQTCICKRLTCICKRLTLSAASVFVSEGLFIYIHFPSLKKIIKIGFPELEKKFLQRFRSFFSENGLLKY